jgi:hypothetical protein
MKRNIYIVRVVIIMICIGLTSLSVALNLKEAWPSPVTSKEQLMFRIKLKKYNRNSYNTVVKTKDTTIILPWAENRAYKPAHLNLFLMETDSIYKPANSDSIYIYRAEKQYHFVLRKRIWK